MLDREQLRHLANLAKIELNDEELEKLQKDLNEILNYVEQIDKLNLDDVELLTAGPMQEILMREDLPENKDIDLSAEALAKVEAIRQIIAAFPEKEGNYLKVPKIIEK